MLASLERPRECKAHNITECQSTQQQLNLQDNRVGELPRWKEETVMGLPASQLLNIPSSTLISVCEGDMTGTLLQYQA